LGQARLCLFLRDSASNWKMLTPFNWCIQGYIGTITMHVEFQVTRTKALLQCCSSLKQWSML